MKLKKVISGQELQEKMKDAVNLLCDTVKTTLGPKGNNIIIDHSAFSPFITNDGVTIAENIESDDPIINTILELAKEAAINTNNLVGDGTTTTLVLLQQIYNIGKEEIESGKSPIIIKKELEQDSEIIISKIKNISKIPSRKDLVNIATTSANSEEIGKLVSEAFFKVKSKDAIRITENNKAETEIIYKKGYYIETILSSPYFLLNNSTIELDNSKVLLFNSYLESIEELSIFINYTLRENKPLIVLAEDYSESLINNILAINSNQKTKIYLLKIPEYGINKIELLQDIELITAGKIITNSNDLTLDVLGESDNIKISEKETRICFTPSHKIDEKISQLKRIINQENMLLSESFVRKRISMFENGLVDILVGAQTATERREKKMRFDDSLCALTTSSKGVVVGSGVVFYKILDILESSKLSSNILQEAIKKPFKQIMDNSGLDSQNILAEIKNKDYKEVYNVITSTYENWSQTSIIDPTEVIISSLKNATSIASMLLTTTSLIINEYQNNSHKINDFTDL